MKTDAATVLNDLNAGAFSQKVTAALAEVALGTILHGKVGKVAISLEFKQIENSDQVAITHKLTYSKPTEKGKVTEENTTSTPMFVGKGGLLSIMPDTQESLFS